MKNLLLFAAVFALSFSVSALAWDDDLDDYDYGSTSILDDKRYDNPWSDHKEDEEIKIIGPGKVKERDQLENRMEPYRGSISDIQRRGLEPSRRK